jgi:hypothetical protein
MTANIPEGYLYPCPICGEKDFDWGSLATSATGLMHTPSAVGFLSKKNLVHIAPITIRRCTKCGNLQHFAFII